jgi:hypothetical protein
MQEFLYFISFAAGVAAAITINKFAHSALLAKYEAAFYADADAVKARLKSLEEKYSSKAK